MNSVYGVNYVHQHHGNFSKYMVDIVHNRDKNCFILRIENDEAVLAYRYLPNNGIDFTSTFVPRQFRGKGLAEQLVAAGLSWAREQGLVIQASCWYVDKFLH